VATAHLAGDVSEAGLIEVWNAYVRGAAVRHDVDFEAGMYAMAWFFRICLSVYVCLSPTFPRYDVTVLRSSIPECCWIGLCQSRAGGIEMRRRARWAEAA
jgi:hypothetical protein